MNYKVLKLNLRDVLTVKSLYQDFESKAVSVYGFDYVPIDFETFAMAVDKGLIHALALFDGEAADSLLIYSESNQTIELNIIHCLSKDDFIQKKSLLIKTLINITNPEEFSLISYPMLGEQSDFTRYIVDLDFKLISQSVMKFMFDDKSSLQVLQGKETYLNPGLTLIQWDEKYFHQTASLIHNSFSTSLDALFDRRFLSVDGCCDVLEKIAKSVYGDLIADASFLVMDKEIPVGFCFSNLTTQTMANIPLIGCKKEFASMGLGSFMLKNAVEKIIEKVIAADLSVLEINATSNTNNNAAMKMYRSVGFKEDVSYAHSYYEMKS